MKKTVQVYFSLFVLALVVGCAAIIPPHQQAGVEVGKLYKFSNPKLDTSLYVKFLPLAGKEKPVLFGTFNNNRVIKDLELGEEGVFTRPYFQVSDSGVVTFRYYSKEKTIEELVPLHPYFVSGGQYGDEAAVQYRLNFKYASIVD